MREQKLRDFFEGTCAAAELARDLEGSVTTSGVVSRVSIEDMAEPFTVSSEMAVRLCDAVLSGELPASALHVVGFALMASDKFEWDGDQDDVLTEVIADWAAPEINYPLTIDNVRRFRAWLTREEPYPKSRLSPVAKVESFRSLRRRIGDCNKRLFCSEHWATLFGNGIQRPRASRPRYSRRGRQRYKCDVILGASVSTLRASWRRRRKA